MVAYLKKHGFVGVGKVLDGAKSYLDFRLEGRLLHELGLEAPKMSENCHNPSKCEYIIRVKWRKTVSRNEAKWEKKAQLYTTRLVRASLANQPMTMRYIEKEFGVLFKDLAV